MRKILSSKFIYAISKIYRLNLKHVIKNVDRMRCKSLSFANYQVCAEVTVLIAVLVRQIHFD